MDRVEGKVIAKNLSDLVNGGSRNSKDDFVDVVTSEHRYLQEEMFELFLKCMEVWSKNYEDNKYDARNKFACQVSNRIMKEIIR